jgi:hypothetical protein
MTTTAAIFIESICIASFGCGRCMKAAAVMAEH